MKKAVFIGLCASFSLFCSGLFHITLTLFEKIENVGFSPGFNYRFFFLSFSVFFLSGYLLLIVIDSVYKRNVAGEISRILSLKRNGKSLVSFHAVPGEIKSRLASHLSHYEKIGEAIDQIVNENYSAASDYISQTSDDHPLSASVALLVANLAKKQIEEQERSWFNDGMSRFSDILSQTELDIPEFCDKLIREVVKYTQSNQGALFLIQKDKSSEEEFLILQSCYAYQRKKYIEKKVEKGVGLIGQCWLEGEPIIISEVPADFIKITSGLGEALPNNVMVVPVMHNGSVEGIIELASFSSFGASEIEFVRRISENIAAQIQSKKINEEIKKLLETSENKTQQLLAQEEELRQNSEEILAQREDLERKVELQKRSIEKLQSSEDSVIINVAGRQRMLTQQMAFFSTMLYHGKMGIKTNLQETVDLFDHSLYTLENGGVFKGVDYDGNIPPAKGKMRDRLLYVKEIWMPVHDCINILLNTDYSLSSISASKEKTFQYIQYIEDNIGVLLNANHRLTQAYVDESFSWRKKVFEDMEDLFSDALAKKDGYESESRVFSPN